jgi:hypothetical protein
MGPIRCPETSVKDYHLTLPNTPAVLININFSVMLHVTIGENTQAFLEIVAPSLAKVSLYEKTLNMKASQVSETSPINNTTAHHIHQKTRILLQNSLHYPVSVFYVHL